MNYLPINDATIRYTLLDGDPARPYLVFLHEGLGCIEMWKDFPELLCNKTHCPGLLYDRSGYGQSSPLRKKRDINYVHDYALRELPGVIQGVIPGKPFILIGHSDGASIGLIFGSEKSKLLRGIVTEAAHVFLEPKTIQGIRIADDVYEREGAKGLEKYHADNTHNIFKAWSDTWLSTWFKDWNIESLLPSISCPLLVIQGSDDAYGTDKQVEAIISQVSGPVTSHIISNCGHAPHLECPEAVLGIMQEFIGKLQY